jgi:hypothetical protein
MLKLIFEQNIFLKNPLNALNFRCHEAFLGELEELDLAQFSVLRLEFCCAIFKCLRSSLPTQ